MDHNYEDLGEDLPEENLKPEGCDEDWDDSLDVQELCGESFINTEHDVFK